MPSLEEITYEAGRHALADQEMVVSGIRQRTGTLLAAHALVASFLGAAAIHARGVDALSWTGLIALVLGLCASAVLLAPWPITFAVDAPALYSELFERATDDAEAGTLGWLAAAGYGYQRLREQNARKVRWMALLSGIVGLLMIAQTVSWLAALALE